MKQFSILLFILLIGCNKQKESKTKTRRIIHPTAANTHLSNVNYKIGRHSLNKINDNSFIRLKNRINNYKTDFTIGKKQGPSYEMFGNIKDALIDNKNARLYVLDAQNAGIEVFNLDGKFIRKVSRKGKGPSELIRPMAIKMLNNKLIIQNGRSNLKIFVADRSKLTYDKTIVSKLPESFCVSKDYLYTKNMTVTNPGSKDKNYDILQYRLDNYDAPVNTFGKLYKADFWGAIVQMSTGGIVCAAESNTVIQFFNYLNALYGYDQSGQRQWKTQIKDFNFIRLVEQGGRIGPDESAFPMDFSYTENAVSINKNYFLVQIENRRMSQSENRLKGIDTYLINYANGRGALISNKLPLILSISSHQIVFKLQKKFPQLEVANY